VPPGTVVGCRPKFPTGNILAVSTGTNRWLPERIEKGMLAIVRESIATRSGNLTIGGLRRDALI